MAVVSSKQDVGAQIIYYDAQEKIYKQKDISEYQFPPYIQYTDLTSSLSPEQRKIQNKTAYLEHIKKQDNVNEKSSFVKT